MSKGASLTAWMVIGKLDVALSAPPEPAAPLSLMVTVNWSESAGVLLGLTYVSAVLAASVLDKKLLIWSFVPWIVTKDVPLPDTTLIP